MWRSSTSTSSAPASRRVRRRSSAPSDCCARPSSRTITPLPSTSDPAGSRPGTGIARPPTGWSMRRGEVYWVDLEPVRGSEANKIRPAVIVSNDAANRAAKRTGRGVVTIVPITSNVGRVYPFQVLLRATDCGLAADSKAQPEQVRTIATDRLRKKLGSVPPDVLVRLEGALRTHLAL